MKTPSTDAAPWHQLRKQLLRFAQIQFPHAPELAEDLVQETLLLAHANGDQFQGNAQFHTWAFAILKNKITDTLRQSKKHQTLFVETNHDEYLDNLFDAQFTDNGHWQAHENLMSWQNPENTLQQRQFEDVLKTCLYELPENIARVFIMRVFLDFDTQEICSQCGLNSQNYYVIMHRARENLRQCLQIKWFCNGETK